VFRTNAQWVQGIGPGYRPTAGTGLVLNLSAGTSYCGNPPVPVFYAGGTLALTASQTNYVYLDPAATCVPAFNITGFAVGQIPLAKVVTGTSTITTVTDVRSWFVALPCVMSATGAIQCSALGTDQNITLTPSGTGYTLLNGNVGIGAIPGAATRVLSSIAGNVGWNLELNDPRTAAANQGGSTRYTGFSDGTTLPGDFAAINGFKENASTDFKGYLLFQTNSGGGAGWLADRMRIDSAGNIGVGKTADANAQLDVAKSIVSGLNTVTFSATPTFDASLGNTQKITLTDNVTSSTLSNATAGETVNFIICQDATGSRTFVWPTNVLGGMTIGATLSKCSAQNFIFDGTNAYALSAGVTNM